MHTPPRSHCFACFSLFLTIGALLAPPSAAQPQRYPDYRLEQDIRLTESTIAVLERRLADLRRAVDDRDAWIVRDQNRFDSLTADDMVERAWANALMLKRAGEIEAAEVEAAVRAALLLAWSDSQKNKAYLRDQGLWEFERRITDLKARVSTMHERRQRYREGCDSVTGTWKWFNGGVVTLSAGGAASGVKPPDAPSGGTWTCHEGEAIVVVIHWSKGGWIDQLNLESGGDRLAGKNQYGTAVWGDRQR